VDFNLAQNTVGVQVNAVEKVTPTDPMPMGAKRKEEYPRGSTLLTQVFRSANSMPKKKPPLTIQANGGGG